MNNLNCVLVEGKFTGEKVENLSDKLSISASIVCERKEEKSIFDVVFLGKMAEFISPKIKKDVSVRIVGRLRQLNFTDETSKLCSRITIICEHCEIKGGK